MPSAKWTSTSRTSAWVVAVYVLVTAGYALCASPDLWTTHTRYNHFVWLADAFLHGQLHLLGQPPAYAGGNDFAQFENHSYVVFPPFPALLVLPILAVTKSVEKVRDGAVFLLLAGIAPVAQLWALKRLRQLKLVVLNERTCVGLVLLFAFGTVYFFTAVQGTVWFAAHIVTTSALSLYLAASIGAEYPLLAGLALCAVIGTRTHLGLAVVFFLMEALRIARRKGGTGLSRFDWALVLRRAGPVLLISAGAYIAMLWYNWARFHDAFEVGYRYLQIAWRTRIERWGMFGYHYLARNLGIAFTSLPYVNTRPGAAPFQINGHGLALWFTTPLYIWLLWPKRRTALHPACYVTLIVTAVPTLLYQNSGWLQFGQRFSNDYAPVLFILLALGAEHLGWLFKSAAVWSIVINLFGALTFQRQAGNRYYYLDASQRIIYEPD